MLWQVYILPVRSAESSSAHFAMYPCVHICFPEALQYPKQPTTDSTGASHNFCAVLTIFAIPRYAPPVITTNPSRLLLGSTPQSILPRNHLQHKILFLYIIMSVTLGAFCVPVCSYKVKILAHLGETLKSYRVILAVLIKGLRQSAANSQQLFFFAQSHAAASRMKMRSSGHFFAAFSAPPVQSSVFIGNTNVSVLSAGTPSRSALLINSDEAPAPKSILFSPCSIYRHIPCSENSFGSAASSSDRDTILKAQQSFQCNSIIFYHIFTITSSIISYPAKNDGRTFILPI